MLAFYLPYRNSVLNALTNAENSKGGPVYFVEVMKAWHKQDSYLPTLESITLQSILVDLFRDDKIYADIYLARFSTIVASPSFFSYSEMMSSMHKGY